MHKWIVLALIASIAGAVQAGEKGRKKPAETKSGAEKSNVDEAKTTTESKADQGTPVTKEQFVAKRKKNAEKKGLEFDQAGVEAQFAKKDQNQDGILTGDEKGRGKAKGKDKDKKREKGQGHDQETGEHEGHDKDDDHDKEKAEEAAE